LDPTSAGGAPGQPGLGGSSSGGASAAATGGTATVAACAVSPTSPRLVPNGEGWIARCTNTANVQGAAYTYASTGSTIVPAPATKFIPAENGKLCISGSGARVLDDDMDGTPEYGKYFGAAMGIDLCATGQDEVPPSTKFTLGSCPLGTNIKGVRFNVTATSFPEEVRVMFVEAGRPESTYVLANEGPNEALFGDGKVIFNPLAPGVDASKVDSIHFMVATNVTAASPFDFCIEDLEAILGDAVAAPVPVENPPLDPNAQTFGTLPTNVTATEAKAAYDEWKADYVRTCNGSAYVADFQQAGRAVSEGIGYGMLLAVSHQDRALFDQLFKFYQDHKNGNDLMKWAISANCGAAQSASAAIDGDLDVAMALTQASCTWGTSYVEAARAVIVAIRNAATLVQGGLTLLRPGDVFGDAGCLNPSYFAPGYYRIFAQVDAAGATRWRDLARDSYTILLNRGLAHATTGLVPNWGTASGTSSNCTNDPNAAFYGYDAARMPWRIATDYYFYGTPEAKTLLTRVTNWVKGQNIALIGDKYTVSGEKLNTFHSPAFVGAFANAAIIDSQTTVNSFHQNLKSTRVEEYYPETLRALYLAFAAGLSKRCF
jgi:endo-1,4-beta-D-glucanase Y